MVFLYIGLVKEPGCFFHKSCNFPGYSPVKLRFLAEVVQQLKLLNNAIMKGEYLQEG
jgi:hypothetical protein